jgi:GT2 family glycosyltransferase
MTDSPRVSVILVNYKGAEDTLSALDTLMALPEYPDTLEIVVVDNASGDGSLELLRPREKILSLSLLPLILGSPGAAISGSSTLPARSLPFSTTTPSPILAGSPQRWNLLTLMTMWVQWPARF